LAIKVQFPVKLQVERFWTCGFFWCCMPAVRLMAWRSGNVLCLINRTALRQVGLVPGTWIGDCLRAGEPSWYVTSHLGQLSFPSFWGR